MRKIGYGVIAFAFVMYMPLVFAQDARSNDPIPIDRTTVEQISSDGTVRIEIESNLPKTGDTLSMSVKFFDAATNGPISNVNYDIVAMQDGEIILSEVGAFAKSGTNQHMTSSLSNDSQVEVMTVLHGMGENPPFSGPIGDTVEVKIVPEFGSIVVMILTLATITGTILPRITHKIK